MLEVDLSLTCKISEIGDLEIFSNGTKKISVIVMALHRRKAEKFEIKFYNKYIKETEKLSVFHIFKIDCLIHGEVFEDKKTEEKAYFTHLIGIKVKLVGTT